MTSISEEVILADMWGESNTSSVKSQCKCPKGGTFSACVKYTEEDEVSTKNKQGDRIREQGHGKRKVQIILDLKCI